MSPLDRTARRRPVTGEAEKAARRGLTETARESLERTVRAAAAAVVARGDADFLERLRDAGLRVRERFGEDGVLVGYAVALPGDRADGGSRPVWFAGSTRARDLSLPRVREHFEPDLAAADWALAETCIREASALWAAPTTREVRLPQDGYPRPPPLPAPHPLLGAVVWDADVKEFLTSRLRQGFLDVW